MQSIVAHIWLNNKGWYDQNASDTCNIIEYTCDIEVTDVSSLYALNVDYVYVTTFVQCMVAFQTNNNNKYNPSNQCLILNAWFITYIPGALYQWWIPQALTRHNFGCGSCHTRAQGTLNFFCYALPSRRYNADASTRTNISISILRHDQAAIFLILSSIYTLLHHITY